MNWFKDNPFLAGLTTVTLLGVAVLGYFIIQSASSFATVSEEYTTAVAKLHTLQNKVPFPAAENKQTMQTSLDDYRTRITALRAKLAKMEVPLNMEVSPQQFQDGLRTAVNEIREKADANGVKLPANFYFGFDQYQTQVPTAEASPFLNRQFLVIQSIIMRLVDFKISSIDGVDRIPLPQETGQPAAGKKKEAAEPVVSRYPFDVSFTAEQPKFRVVFNSLLGSDQFLIVRSIEVQNTSPLAPPKKSNEPTNNSAASVFAPNADNKDASGMQVILGREQLKVALRLEMLDFSEPEVPTK